MREEGSSWFEMLCWVGKRIDLCRHGWYMSVQLHLHRLGTETGREL